MKTFLEKSRRSILILDTWFLGQFFLEFIVDYEFHNRFVAKKIDPL